MLQKPPFKTMKRLILILLFLSITSFALADELQFPFTCYPKKIQEIAFKYGYIIDLESEERTKLSFGFIRNNGLKFSIFTYYPMEAKDFEATIKIINEYTEGLKNG